MAESLGTIYYDVDANLEPLLGKMRQAESALGGLGKEMGKTDRSAGRLDTQMTKTAVAVDKANKSASGAQSAFGGLYKVLAAYIGLQTVKTIVSLSDEYGQMASRIRQVTSNTEEYEMVQRRLLATANETYRSLSEAQEVFIRTADSIRDLGYSTEEALDITDSFSFMLTTNAASADRANAAIAAYSKSIQTGKVSSDQWQSMLAAMPTIVDAIASATGRSNTEIKKLGVEGRLSVEALNEALRRSRDENAALTEQMDTSVQDAFTALRNSLQVFVGKVNESSGATGIFTDAVGEMAAALQDPETIEAAQALAGAVVTSLTAIMAAARETVSVVKWAAESMAAYMHGAASGDIVRLEEQLKGLRELQRGGIAAAGSRVRIGADGVRWVSDKELAERIAATEAQIDAFWKGQEARTPDLPSPVPTVTREDVQLIEAEASATERTTTARRAKTDADREAEAAAQKKLAAQEADIKTMLELREALYQTTLSADQLRDRKAELSLSGYATPEQIKVVQDLAKQLEIAHSAAAELEQRRSAFTGDAAGAIRGQVSPLSGGAFDDQAARYAAEAAAEQERYALQLERLREAKELEIEVIGGYQALEQQMAQEHADRLMQIEEARVQAMAAQSAAAFGAMASDLEAFAKTFGAENSKMMAIAKAAAIAQTIMETYAGAQKAFSALAGIPIVGPALGTAAAAAAIAGGMARVAQIRGTSGRLAGGPVSAGSMYRVNENGAPEVFSAANGQQFMIPNQRGEVISNRNATAGGGGVVINIHNAPQGTVAESSQDQDGQQMIDIWVADFMADGRTASAVQGKFGLSPQGR